MCALCPDNDFTAEKLTLANNVAEYVLPEIMQADKFCAPAMFAAIRNRSRVSSPARVLWALVHVSLQARLHGLEGKDIDEGNNESDSDTLGAHNPGPLTFQDLKLACKSGDVRLRLTALTVLTASLQKSAPMGVRS